MTKDQLIIIAKVAFPERVKEFINFDNSEMHIQGNVYRLYDKDCRFLLSIPYECYLSIHIEDKSFVQIQVEYRAFNHYAAIKEMEKMGLVKTLV